MLVGFLARTWEAVLPEGSGVLVGLGVAEEKQEVYLEVEDHDQEDRANLRRSLEVLLVAG